MRCAYHHQIQQSFLPDAIKFVCCVKVVFSSHLQPHARLAGFWPVHKCNSNFSYLLCTLQGQLLASVNDSLEALGLPHGSPPPLTRGQRWLAAHGLSPGLSTDTAPPSSAQQHGASSGAMPLHHRSSEDVVTCASVQSAAKSVAHEVQVQAAGVDVELHVSPQHNSHSPEPQHVCCESQWQSVEHQSLSSQPQPLKPGFESLSNKRQPLIAEHQPSISQPEPHSFSPARQPLGPEPQTPSSDPQAHSPEPQAFSSDARDLSPDPQDLSSELQPAMSWPQLLMPEPEAISPEPHPLSPDPQTFSPEPQNLSPEPQMVSDLQPEPESQSAQAAVSERLSFELNEVGNQTEHVSLAVEAAGLLLPTPIHTVGQAAPSKGLQMPTNRASAAQPELDSASLPTSSTDTIAQQHSDGNAPDRGQADRLAGGSISAEASSSTLGSAASTSSTDSFAQDTQVVQSSAAHVLSEAVADAPLLAVSSSAWEDTGNAAIAPVAVADAALLVASSDAREDAGTVAAAAVAVAGIARLHSGDAELVQGSAGLVAALNDSASQLGPATHQHNDALAGMASGSNAAMGVAMLGAKEEGFDDVSLLGGEILHPGMLAQSVIVL